MSMKWAENVAVFGGEEKPVQVFVGKPEEMR
jgi:hypothetical protein